MWFKRIARLNNKDEAVELLESELSKRRILHYNVLTEWVEKKKVEHYDLKGKSGIDYQLDFQAFYDNKKSKNHTIFG